MQTNSLTHLKLLFHIKIERTPKCTQNAIKCSCGLKKKKKNNIFQKMIMSPQVLTKKN